VIIDAVTQRYADALWSLAEDQRVLPGVMNDVARLAQSVASGPVHDAVTSPRRDREERRKTVLSAASSMNPLVVNLIGLLFDKNREQVLLGLQPAFHKLQLEAAGQVDGIVESARSFDHAEMTLIAQSLSKQLGKTLNLTNKIVPELVGGARVIAGNRMIDYTVQGRLEALRQKLLNAPLGASRT
jgi:F-type H+-transporting ATPase subunit delta